MGIDLLLLLIDWCEGGDVQSAKNNGASRGNSPWGMVLSTARHFVTNPNFNIGYMYWTTFLLYPINYHLPRAFPTRSADLLLK